MAQLCIEEAIGEKICAERPGVKKIQRQTYEDILDQEFEKMPSQNDLLGRFKVSVLRNRLSESEHQVEKKMQPFMELIAEAGRAEDTMGLIRADRQTV